MNLVAGVAFGLGGAFGVFLGYEIARVIWARRVERFGRHFASAERQMRVDPPRFDVSAVEGMVRELEKFT